MRHSSTLSAFLLLACFGCSSSESAEGPASSGEVVIDAPATGRKVLGVFHVHFDPLAPPERAFTITPVTPERVVVRGGLGSASLALNQADVSLSSKCVIVSPATSCTGGATWTGSSSGGRLDSQVYIQNIGTTAYWDEPTMAISGITVKSGTGTVTTAESSVQIAAAGGSGHTYSGGTYYFSDVTFGSNVDAKTKNQNWATQYIRFNDTTDSPFDFTATVSATETPANGNIYVDADGDTWNLEPFGAAAGGDCNDASASTGPAVGCPTSGGATCSTACSSSTCSYTNSCCTESGTGSRTCGGASGCTCNLTVNSNTDSSMTCQSGTYCKVTSDSNSGHDTIVTCGSGATCTLDCSLITGNTDKCYMLGCSPDTSGGGACTLVCPTGKSPSFTTGATPHHYRCN